MAPSALRTPISRVRSVTEIIMMATTPIPPTIKPTIDSPTSARVPLRETVDGRLDGRRESACRGHHDDLR